MEVPADAYYGASTQRAVLNFPISGLRFSRAFIRVLSLIKMAAAQANVDSGLLDHRLGEVIVQAAQQAAEGRFDDQFVVDIFQTGSGTSTNMNANEVIANRASEILGGEKGSKLVHPNDHVNLGQSSNDVIPTAVHLAALETLERRLIPALEDLRAVLAEKSREFWGIIKTGRTHLQDATPIRLGQEFLGYAGQAERAVRRLRHAQEELSEVALGGTAVGTGVNTHPEFAQRVCQILSKELGLSVRETDNHFQAQNTLDGVVEASGSLRTAAVGLMKIANDIRWLGSGPRAGLGELALPEVQPGSSIMPGKVNPVMPESLIQVCAHVLGNAADNFGEQCVRGLKATDRGPEMVERGLMLGTALAPAVGYDAAAQIAKEAAQSGRTIREVAREKTSLSEAEMDRLLEPAAMTEPGLGRGPAAG
jgi:fumarate hydratase class II